MSYDGILFDLDGTIIDSEPGLIDTLQHMHAAMGWDAPPPAELRRWLGPPVTTVLRDAGHDEATVAAALAQFRGYLLREGLANSRAFDGVPAMLQRLRDAGIPFAIATFKMHDDAQRAVELNGLSGAFTSVHGRIGDEAGHSKAPLMRRAIASLGLPADARIVMVGDRRHDIESAKELGLPSIGVRYGFGSDGELEAAGADVIVADVAELERELLG